jgi:hypothetical protein
MKSSLRTIRDVWRVARGAAAFSRTGATPPIASQSLINLYCRTRGLSNDLLHAVMQARRRPYTLSQTTGVLGHLQHDAVESVAAHIRRDGYYVFPVRLSPEVCDRLAALARREPAIPRPVRKGVPSLAVYDPLHPVAEAYHFPVQTLMDDADIQRLTADPSMLAVAQAYLGSQPVLDIVAMWWSAAAQFDDRNADELAQLYHFDMDRIKWLKFFFYLTDVTPDTGPHTFIAGSHRRGGQPKELLKRGYQRIEDHEITHHYTSERFIEMTGPQGTIIAEDTRGFHKGKIPTTGHRLVLQFEFADSLFGAPLQQPATIRASSAPELVSAIRRHPRVYSLFTTTEIAGPR